MATDWVLEEILTGMQKLIPLSLESTPAAEVMAGTALAWHEVLVHGRVFDPSRDRPRFREAFRTLAARQRRWPAPVDFLEALPRPVQEKEPVAIDSDKGRAVGMRTIADIAEKLRIEPVKPYSDVDDDSSASA
jgi:hypothetical protein